MACDVPVTHTTPIANLTSLSVKTQDAFAELMASSIGVDSVYAAMLDKIETIAIDNTEVSDGSFSDSEKAKLIAQMAAAIVPSMTNQAMQTAFQIAKEDRDGAYQYPVLQADVDVKCATAVKISSDADSVDATVNKLNHDSLLAQASLYRDFGVTNTPWLVDAADTTLLAYGSEGMKYFDELGRVAQTYYTYAKSYRENGAGELTFGDGIGEVTWSDALNPNYSGFVKIGDGVTETDKIDAGLTANQTRVQWRTFDGFDDNMVQHGVNASANMVATMFTEESGADATCDALATWNTGMGLLGITPATGGCPTP